ncbi:MAG: AraC family transcriptional regulator [Pseudonocardiales bacterium]|nr:MAG: AraC family transcriptional regulator [Pseudonocardiales bacterium]
MEDEPIVESVRRFPTPPLRSLIAWYSGYQQTGLEPATHRGLPSPYLTLIITLGDPLTVAAHPDPKQPPGQYDTLVGGLHTRPALITHQGHQCGIQLALSPLGARALLGLPAGELAGIDLDAADVLGPLAPSLWERMQRVTTWRERFGTLDEMLLRQVRLDLTPPAEVAEAWRLLVTSGGAVSVGALARRVGWSTRHLDERFRTEIGLGPKAAARVVRFDRARRLLQRRAGVDGSPTLADLAATSGYYDQAHLAREFRDLAGCPPSRWVAEELRNVQAATLSDVPESMHE